MTFDIIWTHKDWEDQKMLRRITKELQKWKDSQRRKPLLMLGVRQCGKTYIIKDFAEKYFQSNVYLNFEESENLSSIFEYDYNVARIISEIELVSRKKIIPGETLLIFDEIQECPRAITALKYFCENLRELHVICAGSLLGVAVKQQELSFPVGKVDRVQLFPMDFLEFVTACGRKDLSDILSDWPADRPVPDLYSVPMKSLFKEYCIIGGMPEAVQTWLDTHDYEEVRKVQKAILKDYADDFSKHAPVAQLAKIRWIWDSVPVQLAKENNKFIFSHVREGKRSSELEDALQWLVDTGLVTQLFLVEKPATPLSAFANRTYFKVYMSDIGLLHARCGLSAETVLSETGPFARYKGAFMENYVLCELRSLGKEPYFWRSGNTAEVDFVFDEEDSIVPVEVKSADNTQAKSFRQFCKKYRPKTGFKISGKNIALNMCEETAAFSLPLYLTWNIDKYIDQVKTGLHITADT